MENEMIKSECENTLSKYFYFINCSEMEKELCNMEMRSIFRKEPKEKYLFSEKNFDPSRSPFIKLQIKSIYIEKNLEDIIRKIKEDKVSYDDFKVKDRNDFILNVVGAILTKNRDKINKLEDEIELIKSTLEVLIEEFPQIKTSKNFEKIKKYL